MKIIIFWKGQEFYILLVFSLKNIIFNRYDLRNSNNDFIHNQLIFLLNLPGLVSSSFSDVFLIRGIIRITLFKIKQFSKGKIYYFIVIIKRINLKHVLLYLQIKNSNLTY